MSDVPSKKFLQLIKVSLDDSANVVRDFADCKVIALSEYGGSVIRFLKLKKHDLYHKWQIYKPCCCCGGNKFEKGKKEIDRWKFDLLYDIITDRQIVCMKGRGQSTINGTIQRFCICNFIPRQTISLNEMDISMLSMLLRDCKITQSQLESIQNINKQRCRLCHAYSTCSLSTNEYDDLLQNIENSTLELAMDVHPCYHKLVQKNLTKLKSCDFTAEETKKLQEMILHELCEMQITNNNLIKNGIKTHDRKIVEVKDEMIQNQNMQFAEIREQIQQLTAIVSVSLNEKRSSTDTQYPASSNNKDECYTEKLNPLLFRRSVQQESDMSSAGTCSTDVRIEQDTKLKRRHRVLDENHTNKFKKLLSKWSAQSKTDMADVCEFKPSVCVEQGVKPKRRQKEIVDETEKEKENTTLHKEIKITGMEKNSKDLKAKESSQLNIESEDKIQIRASCKVEGKNIDESAAIQSLSDSKHDNPLDLSFSIKSAEKKCILLELEVPSEVLKDKVLFRVALRKLIVKIAHAGNVDINKQSTITLQLTFKDDLSEDIIKEIQALSNNSDMSCDMNRSIEYNYNQNEDFFKEKWSRLENENVTLKYENGELYDTISEQRKEISYLKLLLEQQQRIGMTENSSDSEEDIREVAIGRGTADSPSFVNRRRTVSSHRTSQRRRNVITTNSASPRDSGSESMSEAEF